MRVLILKFQEEANANLTKSSDIETNDAIFKVMQKEVDGLYQKLTDLAEGIIMKEKPKNEYRAWLNEWLKTK